MFRPVTIACLKVIEMEWANISWCIDFLRNGTKSQFNQCWLPIPDVLWHSIESSFTASAQVISLYNQLENYVFEITVKSPKDHWVKTDHISQTLLK